jgi:hypothetical protein
MRLSAPALAAVLLSVQVVPAVAQTPQTPDTTTSAPLSPNAPAYSVDRVKRELRQVPPTTITERRDGLKLEYYVQVFGSAPQINFFKDFDIKNGPVPFTAPTHADMLEQMTPQQYRQNVADIPAFLKWLGQQLSKKK